MEIKGSIGNEVYVKATIKMIQVGELGTSYFVQFDKDGDLHEIRETDVKFFPEHKEKKEAAPDQPKRKPVHYLDEVRR